jgi:hypothetical protein
VSKAKDAKPTKDYTHYRERNLYRGNLPLYDHNPTMPNQSVKNEDMDESVLPSLSMPKIIKPTYASDALTMSNKPTVFSGKNVYSSVFTLDSSNVDPVLSANLKN